MSTGFFLTFINMAMLICLIIIGYVLKRASLVPEHLDTVISKLVVYIFLPAINLYTFMTQCTVTNFKTYSYMIIYGFLFYIIYAIVGTLIGSRLPAASDYTRGIYKYCLAISNTGAVGTPLVLALFGEEGLFIYYMYLIPATIVCYAWAVPMMMPSDDPKHKGFRFKNIINPPMIGIVIGMLLGFLEIPRYLPDAITSTVKTLGNCYPPLSLIAVGYTIAAYKFRAIIQVRIDLIISVLKLLVFPAILLVTLKAFHAPQMLITMSLISLACPVGMNCVVYPAAYGEDSTVGAGLVVVTYLAAIFTVPLWYSLI